jgi:hypothetical protein
MVRRQHDWTVFLPEGYIRLARRVWASSVPKPIAVFVIWFGWCILSFGSMALLVVAITIGPIALAIEVAKR